tara:strand:- start:633 stop:1136 length:504 start_codon:yes stop_codon:yes gene_type:complete
MAKKNITLSMDKLVDSPICDSNACYESEFQTQNGPVTTWLCLTSGFTTNTEMKEGEERTNQSLELTADLIRENQQVHDGLVWLPTVITMADKGMIFPDGKSKDEWEWTVVKSIPVKEDEKEKYPIPNKPGEFYQKRMDMDNLKRFGKLEFMDAAEELGLFGNLKNQE